MHSSRLAWLAAATSAALLVLACGEGRLILDVDALSFLGGQGNDTVHYTIPGGTSGTVDNPPVKVTVLEGLGNSTVDTATLTVAANVENLGGSGQVKFQIFLNPDAATLYNSTPYAEDSAVVSGLQTDTLAPGPVLLPVVAYSIFEQQPQWYVGVRVVVNANAGPPMDGKLRLTTVRLRIILQENIF